jgi:hypothetical protein
MASKSNNKRSKRGAIIAKIRKPIAPPSRTIEDTTKYSRTRERQRARRKHPPEES